MLRIEDFWTKKLLDNRKFDTLGQIAYVSENFVFL